jgi:hypothetical protein
LLVERTLGVCLLAATLGACSPHPGPTRDIVMVARGMTFVIEERADIPNPVIFVRAGERVRLVLKNEAPGLLHDLAIPAWDVAVDLMRAGETREITFVVPDAPGRVEYHCRPHAGMMTGFVDVSR